MPITGADTSRSAIPPPSAKTDATEIAILRRNYPKYGSDMKKWDQKLQYRQKKAIETQARKLGLA